MSLIRAPMPVLLLGLALVTPAAARGVPDDMKPSTAGLPDTAVATGQDISGALASGRALLAGNNPAQAISAFRIALAMAPQSVAALNGIAIAYDRLGRADLARQHFELALAAEPDAADIAYNLGLSLVHAGADRAAIAPLQRAAAGNDPRAAAAARRTLALIAARLTTPAHNAAQTLTPAQALAAAPAAPAAAPAQSRIDIASSGEAILVLAPQAAPLRVANTTAHVPAAAPQTGVDAALADRLGSGAALIIPIRLPQPATPEPLQPPSAAPIAPPAPRRVASVPAAIAAPQQQPDSPAKPHTPLPVAMALIRPAHDRALAATWRPVPASWQPAEPGEQLADAIIRHLDDTARRPLMPPVPHDEKAMIRLAIARLEALVNEIVTRG